MQQANDGKQTRRLQIVGGSTYVVSLPKNWITEMKLKPNSVVSLVKNPNNSITIYQDAINKEDSHPTTFIGKDDSTESIRRKIIAMYLAGYNIIEIKTRGIKIPIKHSKVITELVRNTLIGTEIIESSSDKITLQVLTRLSQLSFGIALNRMYDTASNMHREVMDALKNQDIEYAQEIIKMADEVDRFSLYMRRNLNLALQDVQVLYDSGLENPSECLGHRTVVKCVERIADHAALIAKKMKFLDGPLDSKILKEIETSSVESIKVFEEAIQTLIKRDYDKAENIASKIPMIIEREKKIMKNLDDSDPNNATTKLILEDIRRIAEYTTDIVEVVIDENINSVISK